MKFPRFRLSLSSRGLRVGFAVLSGVFVSVPLFRCNTVRAAAADLIPVQLTAEQTLALYGLTIPAYYYNGASTETASFNYVGTTFDVNHAAGGGEATPISSFDILDSTQYSNSGLITSDTYIRNTNYLIYKWDSPATLTAPSWDFSFQVQLETSVNIQAVGFGHSVFWSKYDDGVNYLGDWYVMRSHYTVYGDDAVTVLGDYGPFPHLTPGYQGSFGSVGFHLVPATGSTTTTGLSRSFYGSSAKVGAFTDENSPAPITIGKEIITLNSINTATFPTQVETVNGSPVYSGFTSPAVYILISCPTLYGDYVLPDNGGDDGGVDLTQIESYLESQGEDIANISEEVTVQTRQLIAILAKLNDIYTHMLSSGQIEAALAIQTNALISAMQNTSSGIVSGIQGLFVPSQSDIIAFDTNMRNLIATTFLGVSDAKEIVDDSFEMIGQQTATQTVDLPLIDLRSTGVNFYVDPQTLSNAGLTVSNGKIKVPVKPRSSEWGTFYEIAAYAIDIIATIAFINMLLNRIHALLVGEKVVEIDGN